VFFIKIIFDKTFEKFLKDLQKSTRTEDKEILAEIIMALNTLRDYGEQLTEPLSKNLKGNYKYNGISLKELRIFTKSIGYRIFYFNFKGKTSVLLQPEEKKTQKLNNKIINNVFKKMKEWIDFLEEEEDK